MENYGKPTEAENTLGNSEWIGGFRKWSGYFSISSIFFTYCYEITGNDSTTILIICNF